MGAKEDEITLTCDQFETALQNLKTIFQNHFMINTRLKDDMHQKSVDPDAFSRQEKKQINSDFRGAFVVWLRTLLGDKAFVFALLRHGIFDFSDLRRCVQALRQELTGSTAEVATCKPDPELRQAALRLRRQERDAKKWARWTSQGWNCTSWQQKQIILLETGELEKRVREANAAYEFGKGAEERLSREQAMIFEVFTNQQLKEYMK